MAAMVEATEIAWAAGLLDGEGSIWAHSGSYPTISVAQSGSTFVLERFQDAMGGRGRIYGPFYDKNPDARTPRYVYRTRSAIEGIMCIILLGPYVSIHKARQMDVALEAYRTRHERGITKYNSPEHRAKLGALRKGHPVSPETRAKISAGNKGKPKSPEHRAKIAEARRGTITSEETKKKLSDANLGQKRSEETRAKMVKAWEKRKAGNSS
jgi:hypothetical protein